MNPSAKSDTFLLSGDNDYCAQARRLMLSRSSGEWVKLESIGSQADGAFAPLVDQAVGSDSPIKQNQSERGKASGRDRAEVSHGTIPPEFIAAMVVTRFISSIDRTNKTTAIGASSASGDQGAPRNASGSVVAEPAEVRIKSGSTGDGSVEIALRHPDLGPLRLEMTMNGRALEIVATAAGQLAAEALDRGENALRSSLSVQGIELKTFRIQLGKSRKKPANRSQSRDGRAPNKEA
jgi:flagellar hook-length control protein FliK